MSHALQDVLSLGSPRFDQPEHQRLCREQGAAAAWLAWARDLGTADPAPALARIRGGFAVALPLSGDRILLAVDRFAIETLCYRVDATGLRFAARADTLGKPGDGLESQALFDYLYFHAIPSPETVFQGVQRLSAGHMALWDLGRLTLKPFWTPSFQEPKRANFDALKAEFLRLVEQGVRSQLDGSKAACFLSGGTDSSTVAGMITRVTGQPADCYSIGFEAEGYDEMAYARIAAQHFGVRHHEYYVTPDDLVTGIPKLAQHLDQPFGNSSAVPAYFCAAQAKADGVTHLLAGDGGDELFGGNSRYAKQRVFGWYQDVPQLLRSALLEPLFDNSVMAKVPLLKKGSSYIEQAKVPMPARLQMYNLLRRLGMERVLTPGFLGQIATDGPNRLQQAVWDAVPDQAELNRMLAFDWRFTLAESDLPKVRNSCELAGVTVGYPLLDDALLDFSLSLPAEYKLKGLKLRWFFKEALRGFLPEAIITKQKHGFGLPFGTWATRHAPLRELATDSVQALAARGVVQPAFIKELLTELMPAHPGYYGEMVWILMMLEQWLQHHRPEWRLR